MSLKKDIHRISKVLYPSIILTPTILGILMLAKHYVNEPYDQINEAFYVSLGITLITGLVYRVTK